MEIDHDAKGARMTDTEPIRINQVGTVFVAVADQDRALEFYVDKLGFEKRADFPYGKGSRWVEVAPHGSAIAIALVPPSEGRSAGSEETHCALTTEDIKADHATLRARGVDVDAEIAGTGTPRSGLISIEATVADPVPAQFFFRDPDGNRFLIVQPG
jgi:catechol 2,3-dioxygenase-like lactoylglutathione lyase family enzyme